MSNETTKQQEPLLQGSLEGRDLGRLHDALVRAALDGSCSVDLSRVETIDLEGFAMLQAASAAMRARSQRLMLIFGRPPVRRAVDFESLKRCLCSQADENRAMPTSGQGTVCTAAQPTAAGVGSEPWS